MRAVSYPRFSRPTFSTNSQSENSRRAHFSQAIVSCAHSPPVPLFLSPYHQRKTSSRLLSVLGGAKVIRISGRVQVGFFLPQGTPRASCSGPCPFFPRLLAQKSLGSISEMTTIGPLLHRMQGEHKVSSLVGVQTLSASWFSKAPPAGSC